MQSPSSLARRSIRWLHDGLLALVRWDLIRPEAPDFSGEEAYRFRHILIRDAAYRSLSKNVRADLHERFAAWLEMKPREHLREFDEIVGYHSSRRFSTASRLVLGTRSPLAREAATRQAAAGEHSAAATFPRRLPFAARVRAARHRRSTAKNAASRLGAALIECGRLADAERVLGEAERLAAVANDERAASHVLVMQQLLRLLHVVEGGMEEAARTRPR